jgi:hypothetical protein
MQLIVSGSRNATLDHKRLIWRELDLIHEQEPIELLIEGGARGVDRYAMEWARERRVPSVRIDAEWEKHGRAAGHIRNQAMLDAYPEALILAFPLDHSPGTYGMIKKAEKLGRSVRVVKLG